MAFTEIQERNGKKYYYRVITYREGKKIGIKDAFRAAWCIWKYNTTTTAKIIKYITHGSIVASVQFFLMVLLVQGAHPETAYALNIANIISIEGALLVGFLLHSSLTWRAEFTSNKSIIKSLFEFHLITGMSILTRIGSFYLLNFIGIHYIVNLLFGISIAIIMNYFGYDKIVFGKDRER